MACSQHLLLTGTSRESPSACVQIESVIIQWPMKSRVLVLTLALSVCVGWAVPELQGQAQPTTSILVKAGKLLDVRNGSYIEDAAVLVEGANIKEVGRASVVQPHAPQGVKVIDLGRITILPGLIDCHTHLMARISDTPDGGLFIRGGNCSRAFDLKAQEGGVWLRD